MYVHMELFSKLILDVEPLETDYHLLNKFFATKIHVFFVDSDKCLLWLLCASVMRSSKWLHHIHQFHFVNKSMFCGIVT